MISPVLTPLNSPNADSPDSSISWQEPLNELGLLRAQSEHLSLAVTAMSHEFRQGFHLLLGALRRCGTVVHSRGEQATIQNAKELVRRIMVEFESLAALAALAGFDSGAVQLEAVAVRPILFETYARWQSEAHQKGIRLRMVLNDVTVRSNARWLGIIVSNIVGNAVRHTNAGEVSIEGQIQATDLILAIRDSGNGIDEAEIQQAFDGVPAPRPSGRGLGLGLSIVRRAAELLRHDLGISSTPCKGTAVRLRIPIVEGLPNREPLLAYKYLDATQRG
jgi:signal transduction histidine kinase